ncbi:AraD1 family protein [Mangrovicoccus algicola]|uniref:GguC protein n=1 Tax=Mangrovicoccus algicola TaxID=2771008 RepID=A0A8J7CHS2_9RHOB|nr:AraD1 family protein [Mangrovicoccus algicola]MBE3638595.1 GguC protein [Mangrovicoccus algicola]
MLLSQYDKSGRAQVVVRDGTEAFELATGASLHQLALDCIARGDSLRDRVAAIGLGRAVDLAQLYEDRRLLPPVTHPDPAHLHLSGTGLTHLGSAATRDAMHAAAEAETDSMRMFRMGLDGGKPADGAPGVQPEWFYKGNGAALVAPGAALVSPGFAGDGGEEPEIAGVYVIGPDGTPHRIGFALANEFSDHVTERANYLWLAHSKLRPAAIGPELLIGALPASVEGLSRIRRGGEIVFEKPFLSGEANMSHSLANLEHHHFKYGLFRQPGDVHVHMFGTATLSFGAGVATEDGDLFEIEAAPFGLPLRNPLKQAAPREGRAEVRTL